MTPQLMQSTKAYPVMPTWYIDDEKITVMNWNHILHAVPLSVLSNNDSNILAFKDMSQKNNYLVCETDNSIFRAVDRMNILTAWSTITGKQLYDYQLAGEA